MLSGSDIERTRKALGLTQMQLSSVLGIHDRTLYRWEADGFFRAHTDTAALVLQWLIGLDEGTLERWSRSIRTKLATNHVIECQLELHLAVLSSHRSATR